MPNRDELISVLSDPTRRDILSTLNRVVWLYGEEIRVLCELHLGYKSSQPTISRHLSMLIESEMVQEERENSYKRYSINRTVVGEAGERIMELLTPRTQTGKKRKGVPRIKGDTA